MWVWFSRERRVSAKVVVLLVVCVKCHPESSSACCVGATSSVLSSRRYCNHTPFNPVFPTPWKLLLILFPIPCNFGSNQPTDATRPVSMDHLSDGCGACSGAVATNTVTLRPPKPTKREHVCVFFGFSGFECVCFLVPACCFPGASGGHGPPKTVPKQSKTFSASQEGG